MITPITTIGLIAAGGAVGAVARHGVNTSVTHLVGHGFPWGTVIVNILGSFLMGVIIAKSAQMQITPEFKTMLATGVLGAFTTFSTFSLDALTLWQRGDLIQAFLYVMASVILSITALFLALWLLKGSTL